MKAAVFSDTHGNTARMVEAVRRERPDCLIHLGDYERDADILRREFPDLPLYQVCGNCDMRAASPLTLVVELGPVRAFLTHGHTYSVRWGTDRLVYAAMEAGAQIALYGHTHVPDYQQFGGVQVLNPGTAGQGPRLTWALVTVFENGGVIAEIWDL